MPLLRYIHRNPLTAGMVTDLESYPWCSHQGYLAHTRTWNWLHRDILLKMLATSRDKAYTAYRDFMQQPGSEEVQAFFSRKNLPAIFGSTGFIETIRNGFDALRANKEIPEAAILSLDEDSVMEAVCALCKVPKSHLKSSRRGVKNHPRDLAIYALRRHSRKTLTEIGAVFGIGNYSTVSSAIVRAKKVLESSEQARQEFEKMEMRLLKSQRQS